MAAGEPRDERDDREEGLEAGDRTTTVATQPSAVAAPAAATASAGVIVPARREPEDDAGALAVPVAVPGDAGLDVLSAKIIAENARHPALMAMLAMKKSLISGEGDLLFHGLLAALEREAESVGSILNEVVLPGDVRDYRCNMAMHNRHAADGPIQEELQVIAGKIHKIIDKMCDAIWLQRFASFIRSRVLVGAFLIGAINKIADMANDRERLRSLRELSQVFSRAVAEQMQKHGPSSPKPLKERVPEMQSFSQSIEAMFTQVEIMLAKNLQYQRLSDALRTMNADAFRVVAQLRQLILVSASGRVIPPNIETQLVTAVRAYEDGEDPGPLLAGLNSDWLGVLALHAVTAVPNSPAARRDRRGSSRVMHRFARASLELGLAESESVVFQTLAGPTQPVPREWVDGVAPALPDTEWVARGAAGATPVISETLRAQRRLARNYQSLAQEAHADLPQPLREMLPPAAVSATMTDRAGPFVPLFDPGNQVYALSMVQYAIPRGPVSRYAQIAGPEALCLTTGVSKRQQQARYRQTLLEMTRSYTELLRSFMNLRLAMDNQNLIDSMVGRFGELASSRSNVLYRILANYVLGVEVTLEQAAQALRSYLVLVDRFLMAARDRFFLEGANFRDPQLSPLATNMSTVRSRLLPELSRTLAMARESIDNVNRVLAFLKTEAAMTDSANLVVDAANGVATLMEVVPSLMVRAEASDMFRLRDSLRGLDPRRVIDSLGVGPALGDAGLLRRVIADMTTTNPRAAMALAEYTSRMMPEATVTAAIADAPVSPVRTCLEALATDSTNSDMLAQLRAFCHVPDRTTLIAPDLFIFLAANRDVGAESSVNVLVGQLRRQGLVDRSVAALAPGGKKAAHAARQIVLAELLTPEVFAGSVSGERFIHELAVDRGPRGALCIFLNACLRHITDQLLFARTYRSDHDRVVKAKAFVTGLLNRHQSLFVSDDAALPIVMQLLKDSESEQFTAEGLWGSMVTIASESGLQERLRDEWASLVMRQTWFQGHREELLVSTAGATAMAAPASATSAAFAAVPAELTASSGAGGNPQPVRRAGMGSVAEPDHHVEAAVVADAPPASPLRDAVEQLRRVTGTYGNALQLLQALATQEEEEAAAAAPAAADSRSSSSGGRDPSAAARHLLVVCRGLGGALATAHRYHSRDGASASADSGAYSELLAAVGGNRAAAADVLCAVDEDQRRGAPDARAAHAGAAGGRAAAAFARRGTGGGRGGAAAEAAASAHGGPGLW